MSVGSAISGALGGQNDFHQNAYTDDPNKYQYGGDPNGAANRQGQLSQLGQQANATGQAGNNYSGVTPYNSAAMSALGQAQQQANGNDFGAVQGQLAQGLAQSQAASAAQAASSRGGGAALAAAQNQAGNTQAAQGAASANQAAQLKAQMQNQGVQNLSNFANAGMSQQAQMAQANGQLGLGYAGLQQGYEGMNNQVGQAQLQANQNLDSAQAANYNQASATNANVASGNAAAAGGVGGQLLGAGASVTSSALSSSDANAKESVTPQFGGSAAASTAGGMTKGGGVDSQGRPGGGGDMFSASNYATPGANKIGEAQLMARDAHTANFAQLGGGMGNWFNVSNAQPWSAESSAAKSNLSHFMGGSGGDGYAAGMQMSDRNAKDEQSLESGLPNAADELMEKAKPYTYRYKDGPAQQYGKDLTLGPMAQDIERTRVGASLVHDTPAGKMVDTKKAAMAALGNTSRLHERVSKLESFMRGDH